MAKAKKPTATLPAKRITVIVPGNLHAKFFKAVKKNGNTLQNRVNELIVQDLKV